MNNIIETTIEKREEALREALVDVYTTFGCYRAPQQLRDAVPWFIDEDVSHDLCSLPLGELKARHFYEYNVENQYGVQPAEEIKYFLPRMLELVMNREEIHHSPSLNLQRLGQCDPDAISSDERAVLGRFALAYFSLGLAQWPDSPGALFSRENAFDTLVMWDIAALDITPLLAHWLDHEGAEPTLHYVEATYFNYLEAGRQVDMVFAEDRPSFRAILGSWLDLASNKTRFKKRVRELKCDERWIAWRPNHPNPGVEQRFEAVLEAAVK